MQMSLKYVIMKTNLNEHHGFSIWLEFHLAHNNYWNRNKILQSYNVVFDVVVVVFFKQIQGLPITVVIITVIAPKSSQTSQTDGIWEEDLSPSIHPHLREEIHLHLITFTFNNRKDKE